MKTNTKDLLKTLEMAVESLVTDSATKDFTPQLGTALGGLRTACDAVAAHLQLSSKPAAPTPPAKPTA